MNKTLNIAIVAVTLILGAGMAGTVLADQTTTKVPASASAQAGLAQTTLYVKGMSCEDKSCSTAVSLALHRTPGVKQVHIAEMQQLVTVSYDPRQVTEAALAKVVDNTGYPATVVKEKRS